MTSTLYVSNLPFQATEQDIKNHFSTIGEVTKIHISLDRQTGRPRGFCFVSYSNAEQAACALQQLNGSTLLGRQLRITEARPREQNHHTQHPSPPGEKNTTPGYRPHQHSQHRHSAAPSTTPPPAEPPPQIAPARKKFNKHKFQKNRQHDDELDRPKSRRPRIQDFDDEDF